MTKLLYIGSNIEWTGSGAGAINSRNLKALREVLGSDNVDIKELSIAPTFAKRLNRSLRFYLGDLSKKQEKEIIDSIKSQQYTHCFLSHSLLGRLAKRIKLTNPSIQIITFFHNIERQYAKELVRVNGVKHYLFLWSASYNERLAAKYSDKVIALNQRDSTLLQQLYNRKEDLLLPTSFEDVFDKSKIVSYNTQKYAYLFVGVAFFANVEGIKWFVENVMPSISGKLAIVGSGMDKYAKELSRPNVDVMGFVPSLAECYYNTKFVVMPIFSGGGMKTKVAEALMYGKTIFASKEALEGYELADGFGAECNTKQEYIDAINFWTNNNVTSFNNVSRQLFEQKHSFTSSVKSLQTFFNSNAV